MKHEDAAQIVKDIDNVREDILFSRNEKYSNNNDYVSNFKEVAIIARTLSIHVNARQVATILAILKLVRNANGIELGQTVNERKDHLMDLHNYIDLAHLCEVDTENEV